MIASRVAEWQADVDGIDWLDQLANEGRAVSLGGDGYPFRYTIQTTILSSFLSSGPPGAREHWLRESGDIVTEDWKGETTVYEGVLTGCQPNEWLMIEVWDES